MAGALASLLRHVHNLVANHTIGQLTDQQLLDRFAAGRDEAAFALLVRRHGPMVLGLCRRVLGHEQDAEDAFQAAFLILWRKAGSIRQSDVGGFLYRVTYHLTVRARGEAVKRKQRDKRGGVMSSAEATTDANGYEVRAILEEELQRLPDDLRSVLVLCYLEGKTHEEAARLLNWSKCTLGRRLGRGRELLRSRLLVRGLAPMAALTASLFVEGGVSAAVSGTLAAATVRTALASKAAPAIAALAEVGLEALCASKAKLTAAIVLALSMLSGAGLLACRGLAAHGIAPPAEPPVAKASDKPQTVPAKKIAQSVEVQGRVLGADGKPKAGAKLLLLGKGDKLADLGISAEDGRFTVAVPKEPKDQYLVAQADGMGIDFLGLPLSDPKKPVEFRLVKDQVIRGRIVNTEGKPVAGVRVAVDNLGVYPNNSLDSFLAIWKKQQNVMSGLPNGVKHIWEGADTLFAASTDTDGRFVLHGAGVERLVSLRLSGGGIADAELWIVNRARFDPKPYNEAVLDNSFPNARKMFNNHWRLHGPDLSIVAETGKTLRGVVKDADTGEGRPGVVVQLTRNGGTLVTPIVKAKTDAQGRYEIRGARKAKAYMVEVASDPSAGYMACQVRVADTAGYQPVTADIKVKKGVIVTGKVIDRGTGKPIHGFAMTAVLNNNPFVKEYPEFGSSAWFPIRDTTANGMFRVVALPGPVLLMGGPSDSAIRFQFKSPTPDPKYPQYFRTDGGSSAYYGPGGSFTPLQGNFCKVLEIKPDAKVVEQDILLERASALPIQIQDADGKPLSGVWVTGVSSENWHYPVRGRRLLRLRGFRGEAAPHGLLRAETQARRHADAQGRRDNAGRGEARCAGSDQGPSARRGRQTPGRGRG